MPTIKLKTPAKINLMLSVLKKGLDNYHEIETVFQTVSLFDIVSIEFRASSEFSIRLKSNSEDIPRDSSNLAYKAAEQFLKTINKKADVKIYLHKNIPVAAGLGGGSSDAACVLRALNEINLYPLDDEGLRKICRSLGADVPFFLKGGTATGKGTGDVIQPIKTPELDIVIIKPRDMEIKSGWAYEKYDHLSIKPPPKRIHDMLKALESRSAEIISSQLFNSLEYAVIKEYPALRVYKDLLTKAGCHNAILSGSGPSLFGIAKNEAHAMEVKEQLNSPELEAYAVKTISSKLKVD